MKTFFLLLITIIFSNNLLQAQGCVAIRSTGGFCTMEQHDGKMEDPSKWVLNMNNRYFKSYKHYVGTDEQKQRVELGTEVINHAYTADFTLTKIQDKYWSFSIDLPVISNTRSSLYEHGGKSRHETKAFGLGDIRVAAYRWLLDPAKMPKGNIQLGAGIKFATGDYKYLDFFYTSDSTKVLGPVDQSIQLGDGGTGFTSELNAYYNLSKHFSAYANCYYLINPREQNGVSTGRGSTTISAAAIQFGTSTMSVPDQYMYRMGFNYTNKGFTASAGIRKECIPASDLVGGNGGFRRPGFIVSAEPGVAYKFKKISAYLFAPIALVRDRTQSNADKLQSAATGTYKKGDAAFADYALNLGLTFRL
ncbi:MAG: hypothetical protein ABIX01_21670 [Chitinophagaceae bacterium]